MRVKPDWWGGGDFSKLAEHMVENNIKVIENRYEISVPYNIEVVELQNNTAITKVL